MNEQKGDTVKKMMKPGLSGRLTGSLLCVLLLSAVLIPNLNEEGDPPMQTELLFKNDLTELCFTNDLGITDIGDPFVLQISENEYYMYCTSAPNGFYCWRSEDLVHWGEKKMCYTRQPDSWCTDCFWAPEVVSRDGQYYMYYTAKNQAGSLRIGLAISASPAGPFTDVKNEPFFDFGYAAIDANVLLDDNGKSYLYYSRDCSENIDGYLKKSEIYGVALSDDLLSTTGDAVKLLTPEQKWEKAPGDTQWNEGPEMIKHEGRYYLTYSANFFASPSYSLGYAVSDDPLGPFTKSEDNPLLTSGLRRDVSGTGHHSFTLSPDGTQLWAVYHSHTHPQDPSGNRKVNIDRAGFTADGKLFISGPTTGMQPLPSGNTTVDVTGQFQAFIQNGSENGVASPLLTDGIFSVSARHSWVEEEFSAAEDGTVKITLQSETALPVCGIAIYPGTDCLSDIAAVRVSPGPNVLSEEYTVKEEDASPLLLYFDACETDTVEIFLSLKEGKNATSLSEITILSEKK